MREDFNNSQQTKQAIDVLNFFSEITDSYLNFEQRVASLTNNICDYSVEKISAECDKISKQKQHLTQKDEQMFNILHLAGPELANQPIITDYHIALSRANIACNHLYDRLNSLRYTIVGKASTTQSTKETVESTFV